MAKVIATIKNKDKKRWSEHTSKTNQISSYTNNEIGKKDTANTHRKQPKAQKSYIGNEIETRKT